MHTQYAEVSAKKCPKCGETKPLAWFHKSKAKPDGHNVICAECTKLNSLAWRNAPKGRAKQMWVTSKHRAEEKGWEFDLTPEWIQEKLERGVCEVTGIALQLANDKPFVHGHFRPWTPSLDRIDCSRGYTKDNVQLVCWMYNQAKGVSTRGDVMIMVKALAANDN